MEEEVPEKNEEETIFEMPSDLQIMADLCDMMGKLTHANCKKTIIEISAKYDTPETVDLVASSLNYFYQMRVNDRYLFTMLGSGLILRFKNYLWASLLLIGNGMLLYSLYVDHAITIQQIKQRCAVDKQMYFFFAPELGIPHYFSRFESLFELTPITDNVTRDDSEENCIDVMKEELSDNNYALFNELRTNGYTSNSIEMMIIKDELQNFTFKTNEKGFDVNKVFDESPFVGDRNYTYISFAARYGAKECYSLLKKKNCVIDNDVVCNAVFGGCMEIIEDLFKDNAPFEGTLPIALSTHRKEVIDFIKLNFPDYTYSPLDCIMGYNISAFGGSTLVFDPECMHYAALTGYVPLAHFFLMQELAIDVLDDNHETPLIFAARMGFYEMVYYLIKAGANPNIKGRRGETALFIASMIGMLEMGNVLLNEGADPTIRTDYNETPLNAVAFSGVSILADSLLGFNCDVNQENPPLATAIRDGNIEMVDYFLRKHADPNIRVNSKGETPLHLAVAKSDPKFVRSLIDLNANPLLEDNDGITPVMLAFKKGDPRITRTLVNKGMWLKGVFKDGKTLLHYAAMSETSLNQKNVEKLKKIEEKRLKCAEEGKEFLEEEDTDIYDILDKVMDEMKPNQKKIKTWRKKKLSKFDNDGIEFLLRIGLDINHADKDGRTPLVCAIEEEQYYTMFFLIENGANVNVKSVNGNTPLHICAKAGASQALEILLNHGAIVNDVNNDSKTALDLASEEGHMDCIVALLTHGAMFTTPYSVTTSAHLAAARNQAEVVNFFLSCNFEVDGRIRTFDTELRNDDRETMLHVASRYGAKECVLALIDANANVDAEDNNGDSPLSIALYNNHLDIAEILLDKGSDPDTRNSKGIPILFWCIKNNKADAIALLISKKADPDITDFSDKTTIQFAAECNMPRWIRFLSKFKATIDPVDADGNTPLLKACEEFNEQVAEALIECGANVNAQNKEGMTPLHYAVQKGKMGFIKTLVYSHADPCIKNNDGDAPIDLISKSKELTFIDMCLMNGYDINYLVDGEHTHLFFAVFSGKIKNVSFFVERHANVNCVDYEGRTPLYHAILLKDMPIITYLIDHGADPTIATKDGKTPIDAARESGDQSIMMLVDKSFIPTGEARRFIATEDEIRKIVDEELEKAKLATDEDDESSDDEEEDDELNANIIDINQIRTAEEVSDRKKGKQSIKDLLELGEDLDNNGNFILKTKGRRGTTQKQHEMHERKKLEKERKKEQKKLMKKLEKTRLKEEKKRKELEEQLAREAEAKRVEFEDEEDEDDESKNDEKKDEQEKVPEKKKRVGFDENSDVRPYGIQNSSYASFKFLMKLMLAIVCIIIVLYLTKP